MYDWLYIPLWYDSNNEIMHNLYESTQLYIPLWYDSNVDRIFTYMWYQSFTFHSGTILILRQVIN